MPTSPVSLGGGGAPTFSWASFSLNNDFDMTIVSDAVAADASQFQVEYIADLERTAPIEALTPTLWVTEGDNTLFTVVPYDDGLGDGGWLVINRPGLLTVRFLVQAHPSDGTPLVDDADGWLDVSLFVSRSVAEEGQAPSGSVTMSLYKQPVATTAMIAVANLTVWIGPENFFTGIEDDEEYTVVPTLGFSVAANNFDQTMPNSTGYYTLNQMEVTMELLEFG